jgi:hypothetical protein
VLLFALRACACCPHPAAARMERAALLLPFSGVASGAWQLPHVNVFKHFGVDTDKNSLRFSCPLLRRK